MAKEEKDKKDSGEEKPKRFSKKLIIIVVAAVLALGGGGTAAYLIFRSPSDAVKAEPKPSPGIVIPLESITINLAEGHYLKLKLSLQATIKVEEALDGSKAQDLAINLFTNRSVAELSSNEERNRTKKELTEKISEAYEDEIMDVYFTLFVIQ